MAKEMWISFKDGTSLQIVGFDDLVTAGETYYFKNSVFYYSFEGDTYKFIDVKKEDLDGNVWFMSKSPYSSSQAFYIKLVGGGYLAHSVLGDNYYGFVTYNANENKFYISARFDFSEDEWDRACFDSVNRYGKQFPKIVEYYIKEKPPLGSQVVNILSTNDTVIYQPREYIGDYGGAAISYDDFVDWFRKSLSFVVTNQDPYADGGASDTGGGGGSFDGTTEIINEPDSPLVNISNTHFVSLYNPTESQINSLSNYMWNTLAIENWRKIVADPMDAIISLAVLPIDVPSSGTREIYVGAFSTGIACNVASAQYISFDCGTILIPQYSKSYLDYAPYTDISVYIPYVGLRSLPCDAIMGKTIGLKYRIDIFSGACVVYLTVNGSVLLQFTGNCAQPIPFTSQSWGTAVTNAISMVASGASMIAMPATAPLAIANMASTAVNGGFKADITKGGGSGGNTGFLGVQKPYVIIQRPVQCVPANQNTFTGYPSYITATFGDLKGYTEVDKIILENINATESELNELESILKGGVYVNEL